MATIITVSEIAKMIGVEEGTIKRTLERRDSDLVPYLHEPTDHQPAGEGEEDAHTDTSASQPPIPTLDLEGLPRLITKLAFNIPTTDIIENLASQVLHLTLLQQDNTTLMNNNQELQHQNEQLQHRIADLQHQVEELQTQLTEQAEAQSHTWFQNVFRRRKPKGS